MTLFTSIIKSVIYAADETSRWYFQDKKILAGYRIKLLIFDHSYGLLTSVVGFELDNFLSH